MSPCGSNPLSSCSERRERPGFSGELWRSIEPIYAEILDHPFLTGLTAGTLSHEQFQHYAIQDALYLRDFARTLSVAAARAPEVSALTMFAAHVVGTMTAEGGLHDTFFTEFGLTRAEVEQTPRAPTTLAYTSYMLRIAYAGEYVQVLGVVLPCYWIYQEVGKVLLAQGSPNPMYQRWIDTYGGEAYAAIVDAVLAEVDRVGAELTVAQRAAVQECFVTASRYEWMFWDMGWTREQWPV